MESIELCPLHFLPLATFFYRDAEEMSKIHARRRHDVLRDQMTCSVLARASIP
ncbi:MAG: hypothetical protein II369_05700 [Clostridia bacterium]|nr:hypothetical protein [Clostridia bacterium]